MPGLVYDAGVLLAAERRDPRVWALHDETLRRDVVPVVPVVVLAQAWRGGPQAEIWRLLHPRCRGSHERYLDRLAAALGAPLVVHRV